MRLDDAFRDSVVFLGHGSPSGDAESFQACATGFFVRDAEGAGGSTYLVTAAHSVHAGLCDPFHVRLNTADSAVLIHVPDPAWTLHEDDSVDVAVRQFDLPAGTTARAVKTKALLTSRRLGVGDIGPGDQTYTVGLFSFAQGRSRNIPMVHVGHIAAFPEVGDPIEVRDWLSNGDQVRRIEAYVVQCAALPGASGSPVFVRKPIVAADERHRHEGDKVIQDKRKPPLGYGAAFLLGLWHGSWEINPARMIAGAQVRDPAGYGIVIPAERILEVLERARESACNEGPRGSSGS